MDFFENVTVETAGSRVQCQEWKIPSELSYFEGHFPHFPVLPAVAIVDISLALIKKSLPQNPFKLHKVVSAKFQQPLSPGQRIAMVADFDNGDWHVEWRVHSDTSESLSVAAQLRLHCRG